MTTKYILIDFTHWEVTTVTKLPKQRKGYAVEGKYQDGTDKDLQDCDNLLNWYINEEHMTYRKTLTCLKG